MLQLYEKQVIDQVGNIPWITASLLEEELPRGAGLKERGTVESQHYCNSHVHDLYPWPSPMIRNQKLPSVAVDMVVGSRLSWSVVVWAFARLVPCHIWEHVLWETSLAESSHPVRSSLCLCLVQQGGVIWLLSKAGSLVGGRWVGNGQSVFVSLIFIVCPGSSWVQIWDVIFLDERQQE